MRYRAAVPDPTRKDRYQETWAASPSIATRFPRAGRFAVEMRFRDPAGTLQPSPFRQLYEPSMQAYFDLRCPLHECNGGGFELHGQISAMLADRKLPRAGAASCRGSRTRAGVTQVCGLELTFSLATLDEAGDPVA